MTITKQTVLTLNPRHPNAEIAAAALQRAALKYDITTPQRQAHWLAQLAHESALIPQSENLHYSAKRLCQVWPGRFPTLAAAAACAANPVALGNKVYGGRMGNGLDEGYRYRGRGFIQLTGKNNYATYGRTLGLDLVGNPDLLLQYGVSALVAAAYWSRMGGNAMADRGDVRGITRAINGGFNGLADRARLTALARRVLV